MRRGAVVLICAIFLIALSYFFFDRPVALWSESHHFSDYPLVKRLTKIAEGIKLLYLCIFFMIFSQDILKPHTYKQISYCIMALFLPLTCIIKDILKVSFGRYWPLTWVDHNPSFIGDNAYGFHFFHLGPAYSSFPSGHTTLVFYAMTILWILAPKWRPLALLLCLLEAFSLIAMNYHFLGDVIGGAFLGSCFAILGVKLSSSPRLHSFLRKRMI